MNYRLSISTSAEDDIQAAFDWWREHRSEEEAVRWLDKIYPAMESLQLLPLRCALAAESAESTEEIRELLFGVGRRKTHRVLFTIDSDAVVHVVRVRHVAQDRVDP